MPETTAKIAVVIPSYKVRPHILEVLEKIGPSVQRIYVVDDCCPDHSGKMVEEQCTDPRVVVVYNKQNMGVGGTVMAGYQAAIEDGMTILVKIDGDGQMDPDLIPLFTNPIALGEADYTKGNRFFDLDGVSSMPKIRIFGNAVLSFITKISSGYWNLFDPTNGYTAIHSDVAKLLPFEKISRRYFFESDMLFRLNVLDAVAMDIPMDARYGTEESNLKIRKIVGEFLVKNLKNFFKRIFYKHYLRGMSVASIELPLGLTMLAFGTFYGVFLWSRSLQTGIMSPAGSVMLSALPIMIGLQLVLAFISYDIATTPTQALHTRTQLLRRKHK